MQIVFLVGVPAMLHEDCVSATPSGERDGERYIFQRLLPPGLLLFSGLYLFVLPYVNKRKGSLP